MNKFSSPVTHEAGEYFSEINSKSESAINKGKNKRRRDINHAVNLLHNELSLLCFSSAIKVASKRERELKSNLIMKKTESWMIRKAEVNILENEKSFEASSRTTWLVVKFELIIISLSSHLVLSVATNVRLIASLPRQMSPHC